jgi:hypothetical protein
MERQALLPIGTICVLKGNPREVMICARGTMAANKKGERFYYDYGGCIYPQGITSEVLAYFNNEAIDHVVFKGYDTEASHDMEEKLYERFEELGVEKGQPVKVTQKTLDDAAAKLSVTVNDD